MCVFVCDMHFVFKKEKEEMWKRCGANVCVCVLSVCATIVS